MTPFCLQVSLIASSDLVILNWVRDAVDAMPDGLTCHDVCARLAAAHTQLRHVTGKFNGADHSWLRLEHAECTLLDPYPWACASGPLLVDVRTGSPWAPLYQEKVYAQQFDERD